jgi:DNA invertase Pin-like site-specific DNA recombinase
VKLFKAGRSVTDIATALNIGRGSVYRALEAAGMKSASGWDLTQASSEHL